MISLRWKLLLGFGGLLLLAALIGMYSMVRLSNLGPAIDTVMRENYQSVIACQKIKDAMSRMDRGLQFMLMGRVEEGRDLVITSRPDFLRGLEMEYQAVYVPGEGEMADQISVLFTTMYAHVECYLSGQCPDGGLSDTYFAEILPLSLQIQDIAGEILELNEENMVISNRRALEMANQAKANLTMLLAMGTMVAVFAVQLTTRSILEPVRRVTDCAQEIASGNLDLSVPPSGRDELGRLANSFNTMASHLRELRQAEKDRLFRVENTTQVAIDSLPDAVVLINPAGRVELANTSAKQLFDFVIGDAASGAKRSWLAPLLKTAQTGKPLPQGYESVVQEFDHGMERFFLPKMEVIKDASGRSAGIILVLADVTALRQIDDLKSDLLATVSHEVNSPLTALRMALHLLSDARDGNMTTRQIEILQSAREEAERLHHITGSLLNLARFESGRDQFDFQPLSVSSVVDSAIKPWRAAFSEKNVILDARVDEKASSVRADAVRLNLVFSNLLSNALKFTPPGGRVELTADALPDHIIFSLKDNGIGIPVDCQTRIFDRFYRVPGHDKDMRGAGLGLAIAKEIVVAHGGEIRCESLEGRGTTFVCTIPVSLSKA